MPPIHEQQHSPEDSASFQDMNVLSEKSHHHQCHTAAVPFRLPPNLGGLSDESLRIVQGTLPRPLPRCPEKSEETPGKRNGDGIWDI